MNTVSSFHRCWTNEKLDRYFTTEAMAKTKDAFLEVHLPIEQIIVDRHYNAFQELGQKDSVNEEDLKALIVGSTPHQGNRVFSLIGETGSGKSELCQWLFYEIQDADSIHVPILIRRSMTKLQDIVGVIYEHLDEDVPSQMQDITDLWEEAVSKQLVASMLLHLQKPAVAGEIGSNNSFKLRQLIGDNPDFELTMRRNFVNYREEILKLDKARELNLLPEEQFAALATAAGGLADASTCYTHLQRAITDCLSDTLRVENLIEKLRSISDGFRRQNKRPVLLIEDITTFSFLQNDLLDYLFDLGSGNFDVLIGVTTDFERTNEQQIYKAQQTIRERIEGRFVLTNEKNETLFLKENYVKLAQLYLRAVKDKQCSICHNEQIQQTFGSDLYPFNKRFLSNVYDKLQQDGNPKQTPRLYLRVLGQTLRNQTLPPFDCVENFANVGSPTAWFASLGNNHHQLEKLLKWYGMSTNQGVFIPNMTAKVFGIKLPDGIDSVNGHYRFSVRPPGDRTLPNPPAFIVAEKTQPVITTISPHEGLVNTSNTLTVIGANFHPNCEALLNEKKVRVQRISSTRLQVTVPSQLSLGTYSLTITNPDQSQTKLANAYRVKEPSSPSISHVQPNEGEENTSTTIYIKGENLNRHSSVYLGDFELTARWLDSTHIEATVPASMPAGSYELKVVNPDRKEGILPGTYTIKPEDLFGQLDQWLEKTGSFPGRAKFKDGVWQLLDMYQFKPFEIISPFSIADSGSGITYSRGDRTSQLYLHESADSLQAGYIKLTIQPQKELRDLFSQVLALGQGHYQLNDSDHLDHPLIFEWLDQSVSVLQQEMQESLTQGLNMPLDQFIIATKFLVLNNCTGLTDFSPESLVTPITGEPFSSGSMGDRPQKLFAWRNEIESLFIGFFHFRNSIVNYPYLNQVIASIDPLETLKKLRNIRTDKIYDAFSIGAPRNRLPLRGLANQVSEYARELLVIQQRNSFVTTPPIVVMQAFWDLLQPVENVSVVRLQEQLNQLRQLCLRSDIIWHSAWDSMLNLLHQNSKSLDFSVLATGLQELLARSAELEKKMDIFSFLSLQREINQITASSEYEILATTYKAYDRIGEKLVNVPGPSASESSPKYKEFVQAFETYTREIEQ